MAGQWKVRPGRLPNVVIRDLDGVPWDQAPAPLAEHEHKAQTETIGSRKNSVLRCACGASRIKRGNLLGGWKIDPARHRVSLPKDEPRLVLSGVIMRTRNKRTKEKSSTLAIVHYQPADKTLTAMAGTRDPKMEPLILERAMRRVAALAGEDYR